MTFSIENCMKRSGTSRYQGSKISGSQQAFLTETAICIVERQRKNMGYRFVLGCNHSQESHTFIQFLFFFLPYLKDRGLLRSTNFGTMET